MQEVRYLIIDTDQALRRMREDVRVLDMLDPEWENIFNYVISTLRNEDTAMTELEFECLFLVKESLHTVTESDVVKISTSLHSLGISLYSEFKRLNLYVNNHLPFEFFDIVNNDLVLIKV